jgi:hypothetical protein
LFFFGSLENIFVLFGFRGGGGFRIPGNLQGMLGDLVSGGGASANNLIGSLMKKGMTKGSYHLKNRMLNGGLSGFGDVFHPGKDAFNVSILC